MDLKRLGKKIKDRRGELGLSQSELASDSGVARGTLQELELGRGNPTLQTIMALEAALKTNLGQSAITPHQPAPDWAESARILNALAAAPPHRRLASLFLLTKDEKYLDELRALPHGAQFAQVLKKVL